MTTPTSETWDGEGLGVDGFTLRLLAVPPGPVLELLAVLDALHREVQVTAYDSEVAPVVDVTVHDGLVFDREHLEVPRNAIHDQAAAARAQGLAVVDISAPYRWDEVPRALSATAAVGQVDAAAARGDLLAPPMTDAQRHLWRWIGAEFEGQAAGRHPIPYAPWEG